MPSEPEPANGSSTTEPGGASRRTSQRQSEIGFTVGWWLARGRAWPPDEKISLTAVGSSSKPDSRSTRLALAA